MKKEKVSIIVPCYNGAKYIDRCIDSIYRQSYPCIELIVVNDGSTDNSEEKILAWKKPFVEKGFELKYLYKENGGLGSAVNAGLKLVSGSYISLLDADDEYLDGAVEEKVEYLQKHKDEDVVRSNGWIVRPDSRFLFVNEKKEKEIEDVFLALIRGETNNWAGSYMMRSQALFDFYPDREIYKSKYGQNLQLLLPLVYKKKCGFIDKPHMNYIQTDNSLCRTDDETETEKKALLNAEGFKEIRCYLVGEIVKDEKEKNYYLNNTQAGYCKSIMHIAAYNGNKKLLQQAYNDKCRYEKPTLDDKIFYYSNTAPYKAYMLRAMRKIKNCLKKK